MERPKYRRLKLAAIGYWCLVGVPREPNKVGYIYWQWKNCIFGLLNLQLFLNLRRKLSFPMATD